MTTNLTAEQLVTLQLRIMSALSFYRQRPEKEARRMAELLELAGAAASELQEHRKAEPVSGDELDQMIWKLERDGGMTPKLLSLMRELREVRKAKGEPVMYASAETIAAARDGEHLLRTLSTPSGDCAIPLYAAPPAPVVPDKCPVEIRDLLASHSDALFHDGDAQEIWNACRAAMCATAQERNGTTHAEEPVQSVEYSDVESRCGMDTEKLNHPVSETNALPASVVDALEKALQAMSFMGDTLNNLDAVCEEDVEYVSPAFEAVRSVLENNSPVIPDDLTAADNSGIPIISMGWIPVSERMPEVGDNNWRTPFPVLVNCEMGIIPAYYGFVWHEGEKCFGFMESLRYGDGDGSGPDELESKLMTNVTHWQSLPAAPKEVG